MSENRGIKRSSVPLILHGKSKRKNHETARRENYLEVLLTKELVKRSQGTDFQKGKLGRR